MKRHAAEIYLRGQLVEIFTAEFADDLDDYIARMFESNKKYAAVIYSIH